MTRFLAMTARILHAESSPALIDRFVAVRRRPGRSEIADLAQELLVELEVGFVVASVRRAGIEGDEGRIVGVIDRVRTLRAEGTGRDLDEADVQVGEEER